MCTVGTAGKSPEAFTESCRHVRAVTGPGDPGIGTDAVDLSDVPGNRAMSPQRRQRWERRTL